MTTISNTEVATLWRYPVKSMQGEELNACDVTTSGLVGDRQFAVVDPATGKVAGAKNPRKWPGFFYFRAAYIDPPGLGVDLPPVRITMPDGVFATTLEEDLPKLLSGALGREVRLSRGAASAKAEEHLVEDDDVSTFDLRSGTFFDVGVIHLLTTATRDKL